MKVVCVIPARYGSTRLPGKPLLRETGKFLIQHVVEQACRAQLVEEVVVATDDERIAEACRGFGARAVLTPPECSSGSERVALVAAGLDCDVVVNLQGDEPELNPAHVDALISHMLASDDQVGTLAVRCDNEAHFASPHVVKVVADHAGYALYFSRAPIPYLRNGASLPSGGFLQHVGVYAYRRSWLLQLSEQPHSELEEAEALEQLRFLQAGARIGVVQVDPPVEPGIDTAEDYSQFVARRRS